MTVTLSALLKRLEAHQRNASRSFNLTPSENRLSPLATLPFALDVYSRYFLDDLRLFGQWCFPAGREPGAVEREILYPLLKRFAKCQFVNVRPISGINCMTIVLAALTTPGDSLLVVPAHAGGHASTRHVAARLGLQVANIPFLDPHEIDLDALEVMLKREWIRLIYLDQSTLLFPIDPQPIRDLVNRVSPGTLIHYDSSHVNGLIFGAALPNPLEQGADTFGGSTHKTLPGPHKGFIATNSSELASALEATSDHFVSQHKPAEITSLAITLLEFRDCDGQLYAHRTVQNAKAFAEELAACGLHVANSHTGFTLCHQVWVAADPASTASIQFSRLEEAGILTNIFPKLPSIPSQAFRLSLAEFTRMGGVIADARQLARAFANILRGNMRAIDEIASLRRRLTDVQYCYGSGDVERFAHFVHTGEMPPPAVRLESNPSAILG